MKPLLLAALLAFSSASFGDGEEIERPENCSQGDINFTQAVLKGSYDKNKKRFEGELKAIQESDNDCMKYAAITLDTSLSVEEIMARKD